MSACTFFGHRDCYGLEETVLMQSIRRLVEKGVDKFYVGHQGQFDNMVFRCLSAIRACYPHISVFVVLAYLPLQPSLDDRYHGYSILPEGIEIGLPRFAIERRNRWMLERADYCLCYIHRARGGAYKFAKQAKQRGLVVINLGSLSL